jgi:hypothetical protein
MHRISLFNGKAKLGEANHNLNLVPKLWTGESTPLYVCMVWYLIKHQGQLKLSPFIINGPHLCVISTGTESHYVKLVIQNLLTIAEFATVNI